MLKIFGTDGIRCKVNQEPMTADTCLKIAKATGYILSSKTYKKNRVIISKDTRLSGYLFEPPITSGFISMGMNVILVGPLPTPALPILIKSLKADVGVMITASHNTYEYNGLKFFDSKGNKISRKLEKKIESIIFNKNKYNEISNLDHESGKAVRLEDAKDKYLEYLKSTLDKKINLKKIKIVLDCGNGATYNLAPRLFRDLGFKVICINNHPDGRNINKNCGAVDTRSLSKKILEIKADIGFAFDGDGDRLGVVDNQGKIIFADKIVAFLAKDVLLGKPKSKIILDIKSSQIVFNEIKKLNGKPIFWKTGHSLIKKKMKETKAIFAGEMSGHIFFADKYYGFDDAIYASIRFLNLFCDSNKSLSKIFNDMEDLIIHLN